ncbi:hypothetical protein V0288_11310 [Pannus brasiliensis CCIBt3594]|uniref:Uncharacterized protein n=1 Tax=Pannus brasiliensis CCIBt3594 TaxID=1427578 RepID=A0AAW9QUI0_9CHRO
MLLGSLMAKKAVGYQPPAFRARVLGDRSPILWKSRTRIDARG